MIVKAPPSRWAFRGCNNYLDSHFRLITATFASDNPDGFFVVTDESYQDSRDGLNETFDDAEHLTAILDYGAKIDLRSYQSEHGLERFTAIGQGSGDGAVEFAESIVTGPMNLATSIYKNGVLDTVKQTASGVMQMPGEFLDWVEYGGAEQKLAIMQGNYVEAEYIHSKSATLSGLALGTIVSPAGKVKDKSVIEPTLKPTVDSILTGTHRWDEPDLHKRINQRGEQGFNSGATTFTASFHIKDGVGATGGSKTWVIPQYQADKLTHKAQSLNDIEEALGLSDGALGRNATRINISNPNDKNIIKPTADLGNEYHRPPRVGDSPSQYKSIGLTSGSQVERLIDTQKIPSPDITIEKLNLERK